MKNYSKIRLIAVALVGFASAFSVSALPVTELTKSCKPLIDKTQKLPNPPLRGLPEKVHKRVTRAMEYMADDNYAEGIAGLNAILEKTTDNYIKSLVSMNIASAHAQQSDYNKALPFFQDALKYGEGQLDHARLQGLRQNVASLLYSIDKKDEALKIMNTWMKKSVKDDARAYILLSVMYAEKGDYRKAICPAYYAVKTEKTPKSQYYNLLLVSHYELKDMNGSATILKEMVTYFPNEKNYWRQLSTLYLSMDKVKESLALMEMLYLKGGFDKETDYKTLSSLFAYEEIPYRSAQVLKEGLDKGIVKAEKKNWKNIATNYRVGKEYDKAIAAYGKTAELAEDGEEYLSQADLYFDQEKWRETIKALDSALKKGVKDEGRVYFTKGSALASLGQCRNAIRTLESATKYKNWRKRASAWISFVKDREKNDKC